MIANKPRIWTGKPKSDKATYISERRTFWIRWTH